MFHNILQTFMILQIRSELYDIIKNTKCCLRHYIFKENNIKQHKTLQYVVPCNISILKK